MNQVGMPSIFPYNDSNVDGFISKCKKAINLAPDGDLNINRTGEYRLRTTDKNGHIVRKYISVDDKQFKSYVIKYCAKHIVSAAKCKGDKLQNIDKEMEMLEERFGKHTPNFCKSHKTLIKEWLDDPYIPNPYHPENERTYSTGDGKTYRSKMEYMISKELDEMGIPY